MINMQNPKLRNGRMKYMPAPESFIKACNVARALGGYKNRKDYLEDLGQKILQNEKRLKQEKREYIEFDW